MRLYLIARIADCDMMLLLLHHQMFGSKIYDYILLHA